MIAPSSKLATVRALPEETATSSLGHELGLGTIREAEIYAALDWLGEQQERIERALARRHLHDGTLVLYDVSSSYLVRTHVFLCMLAYRVEWHLREAWAPLLFHEHDAAGAEAERISPVRAAAVSPAAQRERATRRTEAGLPVVG